MSVKFHLIRGRNYILVPLPLIDKSLNHIASISSKSDLGKYETIALNWIRRTNWSELHSRNACEYSKRVLPLTLKEFNWLKAKYDEPI